MNTRTDTEDKWRTKSQVKAESTSAAWKGNISGGKTRLHHLGLCIPSHPAIAVHCSQQPFYFVYFFMTEYQLLPSKLISCKLYELGNVLVIISYIVVNWGKVVGRTRDFWQFWGTLCPVVSKFKLWT